MKNQNEGSGQAPDPHSSPIGPSVLPAMEDEAYRGTDSRDVDAIVAADAAALSSLGSSPAAVAERLRGIFDRAEARLGVPLRAGAGATAVWHEAKGHVSCPFSDRTVCEKGEVAITDPVTDATIRISRLSIHLIEAHGFFQGRNARYRIEPDLAVRLCRQFTDTTN